MAQHTSGHRHRILAGRLLALAVALGTVGTVPASAATVGHSGHHRDRGYREVDLASNIPGRAPVTDPNLVNPWGLSVRRDVLWVSDNGSDKATTYTGATPGHRIKVLPRVVSIPGAGAPTGNVRNDTNDFRFRRHGKTGAAQIIFAGEGGDLFAWNPRVSKSRAFRVAHTETRGVNAVYKGLTLVQHDGMRAWHRRHKGPELLVANFRNARIDVFDKNFRLEPSKGRFRDPSVPRGFAPFNVKVIDSQVFVTYAKQDAAKMDDVAGPGNGFISVFDVRGRLVQHFARRGALNSPWGLEVAPRRFGKFSGDLLVGNFGNGRVHAFDPRTGRFEGTLRDRHGKPITIPGLWGLQRGTDRVGGENAVWFAAGINDEKDGLLGVLRANH